ncbi:MAG: RNA methyltransferase [Candidatus Aureabacteria bacterium]|nr:RNA methyltransferase [Candidatus Auribacterota bacterium]
MQPMLTLKQIKMIRNLRDRKFRYETKRYWAEGTRTLSSLIDLGTEVEYFVLKEGEALPQEMLAYQARIYHCRLKDISRIKSTSTFPGIGAVLKIPPLRPLTGKRIIALDRINDPGNMGALYRTALWFGVRDFLMDSQSVDPFHEKVVRSSMGALGGIRFQMVHDLKKEILKIRHKGYAIIASDLNGYPIQKTKHEKWVLLVGNEANGLSQGLLDVSDDRFRINGSGKMESLNVVVALGIFLHQFTT